MPSMPRHRFVVRLVLALLFPVVATLLQHWMLQFIPHTTWLLLYPAIFFSAWMSGLAGGIISTLLAASLGVYFFLPDYQSFTLSEVSHIYSVSIFVLMGVLFSVVFERLKQSQLALQDAIADLKLTENERLTQALALSNAGLWEWDLINDQIHWSDTLRDLYGLDKQTLPSHDNWLAGVHEEDRVSVMVRLHDCLSQQQNINLEWRVANLPENEERWLHTNGQPLRNADGKIISYRGIVLDITERKKQETHLQEKQQRLDFALNTLQAGAWELNLRTHQIHRTELHDQIFGYQQPLPEWSFEQFVEHVLPNERVAVIDCFNKALQTRSDWQFECQIRRTDGEIIWIYAKGNLKFDQYGQALSMAGIVQDITQRKKSELEKHYIEALYRTLVDQAAPDAVYIHDHQGRFLEVNQRACEHDGYSKAELLCMNVVDLEVDFDLSRVQEAWLQIQPGVVTTLRGHHRRKDGSIYPVEVRFGLLENNEQRIYIVFVRDISEQIQAEEALRNSEREFRMLADVIPQIVWITRPDGWNVFVNQQWTDYTGLSFADTNGPGWSKPFHPDDKQSVLDAWYRSSNYQLSYSIECRMRRRDGVYRWWLIRGNPIYDENGVVLKWFGTCTDIHDMKLTEEALKQSERRYRDLFAANPMPLWIYDMQTLAFLDVNDAAIANYGYSRDEFLTMRITDIRPSEDIPKLLQHVQATLEKPDCYTHAGVWRHLRKDGSEFWVDIIAHTLSVHGHPAELVSARDITQQREAEIKLQESEARWQYALEGSNQGVWDWDIANGKVFYSSRLKSMLGFKDDDFSDGVEEWSSRIHPDELQAVLAEVDKHLRQETLFYQTEHRLKNSAGEYQWILDSGKVVARDEDGKPLRMIGTHQDISVRKAIEQALIESENKLSLFIKHAPVALAMFDTQMRYLAVSLRWIEAYELYDQVVIGQSHYEIFPEINDAWKAYHRKGLAGEVIRIEHDRFIRANGNEVWIRWEIRPWFTSNQVVGGIVIFTEDITERVKTEQALANSERRFQDIVSVSADWIWEVDAQARYTYVSESVRDALGYPPEHLIGKTPFDLMPPDEAKKQNEVFGQIVANRQPFRDLENVNLHQDGSLHVMQTSAMPVLDAEGNLFGYRGLDRDITLRKTQEQQLILYRDQLEKRVLERTHALNAALEQAEHLAKVKSDFLANMSHEIRTPMNAVLGFCYMLEQQALDQDSRALVRKIHTAGRSLLVIINDILDFSKIEAGRLEIENEPFLLSDLLDDLAALMSSSAGKKQLELIVTPAPEIDALIGDGMRLQQVLVNLLSNAIKFTDSGEIELRISIENDNGKHVNVKFLVRDTGIGISPDKQQEIFLAFTQADNTISRRFGGSGLGLAISRELVQLMGSELHVHSVEGQGSEFWFVLPLQRDLRAVSRNQLTHLSVLVAAENPATRSSLSASVNSLGWSAVVVDSGETAFAEFLASWETHNPYDVIILDWQMQAQDGLYTAQLIRDISSTSHNSLPILLMVSANAREHVLTQPGIDCVDQVLTKPTTPSTLFNSVTAICSNRKQLQALHPTTSPEASNNRLAGLRILLVDDSEINREVAQSILEGEGALINVATDGLHALKWLQQHPTDVDIVLMDVQMPVMDGYTATQNIRQDQRWVHLPIIALTAGAFQSLRDAAFNAGMNDFVAKPFDVEQLITVIRRHAGSTQLAEVDTAKQPVASPMPFETDNLPGIDLKAGLKQWGKIAVYLTYLKKFVAHYADAGNSIANYLQLNDREAAAALAHKLKGVSGNLALTDVMRQVQALEAAVLNNSATPVDTATLQQALDQVCASIQIIENQSIQSDTTKDSTKFFQNSAEIVRLLDALVTALDQDNPDLAEPVLDQLKANLPVTEIEPIQLQLADFDFRGAKTKTQHLIARIQQRSL
jgi:PAS domain S-box-containing protein